MKALILAAGLGTRLRPLTEKTPKSLIPVVNVPALVRNIEFLNSFSINEIIVNSHYLSSQLLDFVNNYNKSSILDDTEINLHNPQTFMPEQGILQVRVEPEILGTGGGISNCRDFLDGDTFIVINSDIITNIDLHSVFKVHRESKRIVTMVLHDRKPFNMIQTDNDGNVLNIHDKTGENLLAFTGIHFIEPEIFNFLPQTGYSDIIQIYRNLISSEGNINSFLATGHIWHDVGTIESYRNANEEILKMSGQTISTGINTVIDSSVEFRNWAVIGRNTVIKRNAFIESSVIWDNVEIDEGIYIKDSVVTSGRKVTKNLINAAY